MDTETSEPVNVSLDTPHTTHEVSAEKLTGESNGPAEESGGHFLALALSFLQSTLG